MHDCFVHRLRVAAARTPLEPGNAVLNARELVFIWTPPFYHVQFCSSSSKRPARFVSLAPFVGFALLCFALFALFDLSCFVVFCCVLLLFFSSFLLFFLKFASILPSRPHTHARSIEEGLSGAFHRESQTEWVSGAITSR